MLKYNKLLIIRVIFLFITLASIMVSSSVGASANVALFKSASTSSSYSATYLPEYAFDGNPATRWASKFSDPQWVQVDLEVPYLIDRVVLDWATTSSLAYTVEVSLDGVNWAEVYATGAGAGGLVEITFAETLARYVRMVGTSRNTPWDHSLWEFSVYGTAMADTSLISSCLANPVKIMTIGNSISQGNMVQSSYRRALWMNIQNDAFPVNFVGSLHENFDEVLATYGPSPIQDFDLDHEAHWGWRADQIASALPGWLSLNIPDVVLIHIGTNDLWSGQSVATTIYDLEDIISKLRAVNPDVTILLAQLIPLPSNNPFYVFIDDLNSEIVTLASILGSPDSQIIVVDQNTGFNIGLHTYDGVHPNDAGEQRMADIWYSHLVPVLQDFCIY